MISEGQRRLCNNYIKENNIETMFLIYYWSDSIHFSPYPTGPPANIVLVKNVLSFTGILLAMMFVNDG